MRKSYDRIRLEIENLIYSFYAEFKNEPTIINAYTFITGHSMITFRTECKQLYDLLEDNKHTKPIKYNLKLLLERKYIYRIELLKLRIMKKLIDLAFDELDGLEDMLIDVYTESCEDAYSMLDGEYIIDVRQAKKAVNKEWLESNYISCVWKNEKTIYNNITSSLERAISVKNSVFDCVKNMNNNMEKGFKLLKKLIITETLHCVSSATLHSYGKNGVNEYTFCAEKDEKTCTICKELDGHSFPVANAIVGVNYPQLHSNCRCYTIPTKIK